MTHPAGQGDTASLVLTHTPPIPSGSGVWWCVLPRQMGSSLGGQSLILCGPRGYSKCLVTAACHVQSLSPAHPFQQGTCGGGGVQCPHSSLVMVAHVPSYPPAHAESPETGRYFRVLSTNHKKEEGGVLLWYLHSSPPPPAGPGPLTQAPRFCPLSLLATLLSLWRTLMLGPWALACVVSGSSLPALSLHVLRGREADFRSHRCGSPR